MAAKTYRGKVLKIYEISHSNMEILIKLHFTISLKETDFGEEYKKNILLGTFYDQDFWNLLHFPHLDI